MNIHVRHTIHFKISFRSRGSRWATAAIVGCFTFDRLFSPHANHFGALFQRPAPVQLNVLSHIWTLGLVSQKRLWKLRRPKQKWPRKWMASSWESNKRLEIVLIYFSGTSFCSNLRYPSNMIKIHSRTHMPGINSHYPCPMEVSDSVLLRIIY